MGSALHAPPAAQDWPQPATFSPAAFPDATPEALQAALDRAVEPEALAGFDAAIERDPAHHPRVGEVARLAAHLGHVARARQIDGDWRVARSAFSRDIHDARCL